MRIRDTVLAGDGYSNRRATIAARAIVRRSDARQSRRETRLWKNYNERAMPRPERAGYGRIVTFLITGGETGLLISPSPPSDVGVSASASTTSMPLVTCAKIT